MKSILSILLFFGLNANSQIHYLGVTTSNAPPPGSVPILIVFAGESNSGGLAANSYATAPELAVRTLPIFNNISVTNFDFLQVGSNNLLGHVGLNYADSAAHGWELELANRYADGDFGARPVYICKAGQGGTTIGQWDNGNTYTAEGQTIDPYATLIDRVTAAKSLVITATGQTPLIVMFWSQGINDKSAATDTATWRTITQDVFTLMRSDLGITLPIYTTQFQSMADLGPYNAAMVTYASILPNITVINTTGAETSEVFAGAGGHWGYTGMKQVANSLIDALISDL